MILKVIQGTGSITLTWLSKAMSSSWWTCSRWRHYLLSEISDYLLFIMMSLCIQVGECGSECRTIAKACEAILEEADVVDFSQEVFQSLKKYSSSQSQQPLVDMLCRKQTSACKKKTPILPKVRSCLHTQEFWFPFPHQLNRRTECLVKSSKQ